MFLQFFRTQSLLHRIIMAVIASRQGQYQTRNTFFESSNFNWLTSFIFSYLMCDCSFIDDTYPSTEALSVKHKITIDSITFITLISSELFYSSKQKHRKHNDRATHLSKI